MHNQSVLEGSFGLVLASVLFVACGRSERSQPNGSNAGGSSASGSGAGAQGANAGSGGTGAAWFEILEPLPSAILTPDLDPAEVTNETVITDSSEDGSVLVGYSWAAVALGAVAYGSEAFRFTRAGGVESLGYVTETIPAQAHVGAEKVSRDGAVIVGSYGPGALGPFFRWTAETGMLPLDPNDDGSSLAFGGMSDDGAVLAATQMRTDTQEGVRWTEGTGLVGLGFLPGHSASSASQMSRDGRAIVGSSNDAASRILYRWTEEDGMISLGLSGCFVVPGGVGQNGAVVVAQCTDAEGAVEVRVWTEASGAITLGAIPEGVLFQGNAASADAKVLVGRGQQGSAYEQAYRVDEANGVVGLGTLPGLPSCFLLGDAFTEEFSKRSPMNRDASVVAGTCVNTSTTAPQRGFRWSKAAGLVALEPLPGHVKTQVTSVSPDGIVGGVSSGAEDEEVVIWNERGEAASIRAELEAAGVDLDGFRLDGDVFVVEGGRIVHGFGHDAAGAGRAWVARRR